MPAHQGGESRFIPILDVACQEPTVGQPRPVLEKDGSAQMLHDTIQLASRHWPHPRPHNQVGSPDFTRFLAR
jgi:hypothetical protein